MNNHSIKPGSPNPQYPAQRKRSSHGTTFQIVKGAIRFRENAKDEQEMWQEFIEGGRSQAQANLRNRPKDGSELVSLLKQQLLMVTPPPDRDTALARLQKDAKGIKPTDRMAAAVSIGEIGQKADLEVLGNLLSASSEPEIRASAVQGMARLLERTGVPTSHSDGMMIFNALRDGDSAVRDFARECLLGQGWIKGWIESGAYNKAHRLELFAQFSREIISTHRFSFAEKENFLQQIQREGEPLSSVIGQTIQNTITNINKDIEHSLNQVSSVKSTEASNVWMRIQSAQIIEQKRKLRFFENVISSQ
jgi:predicted glycoside hydrolase/deacetylase ChbG (UPF0249 family)